MTIKTTVWMKQKDWNSPVGQPFRVDITDSDLEQLAFNKAKEYKSFPEDYELKSVNFDEIKL